MVHKERQHFTDALNGVPVLLLIELLLELGEELYDLRAAIMWILEMALKQACLEWVHLYIFETSLHIAGEVCLTAVHKLRGLLCFLGLDHGCGGRGCGKLRPGLIRGGIGFDHVVVYLHTLTDKTCC